MLWKMNLIKLIKGKAARVIVAYVFLSAQFFYSSQAIAQESGRGEGSPSDLGHLAVSLTVDNEIDFVDKDLLFEIVMDFAESTDEIAALLTIRNVGDQAATDVTVDLVSRPAENIQVEGSPVAITSIAAGSLSQALFTITTSDTPPGFYSLDVTVDSNETAPTVSTVDLLVLSFTFDLSLAESQGVITVSVEAPNGTFSITATYDPNDLVGPIYLYNIPYPTSETMVFTPTVPFYGLHPPEILPEQGVRSNSDKWVKKLLAGLINFGIGGSGGAAAVLGGPKAIAKLINKIGLRGVLKKAIVKFMPGIGYVALAIGLCSAVMSAWAADPPDGDFFYIGEENTDPGALATVEEWVHIEFTEVACDCGVNGSTRVAGTRTFHRVLSDETVLEYQEVFDQTADFSLAVTGTADQSTYNVGDPVLVTAAVNHPNKGMLVGAEAVATAAFRPLSGSASPGTLLRDDGLSPDETAEDGIYSGSFVIPAELVCSGAGQLPIEFLAQATANHLISDETPEFSIGTDTVSVTVNPESPVSDIITNFGALDVEPVLEKPSPVTLEVNNIGEATTGTNFTVQLWLSADLTLDGSDELLDSYVIDALPPGAAVEIETTYTVTGLPRDAVLLLVSDPSDQVTECNEDNNLDFQPITIHQPHTIPTVSEWGLIVLAALLLAAGAIVIRRRLRVAA